MLMRPAIVSNAIVVNARSVYKRDCYLRLLDSAIAEY
jgi:hypothetical protein